MPPDAQDGFTLEAKSLLHVVQQFPSRKVLVVGDIMLDHYMQGEVERISPEAPVPVLQVSGEWHVLGGAGNVARNIAALGATVDIVCVIGADGPGQIVQGLLAESGISGHLLAEKRRLTTVKTRIIARNQQLVRVDREDCTPLEDSTARGFLDVLKKLLPEYSVVVVSDYGKGVVSDLVMQAVRSVRNTDGKRPKVLVDPKVVNTDLYTDVFMLTPNAKEAAEMTGIPTTQRDGVIRAGLSLFKKLRCEKLCITLGAQGMAIFEQPQRVFRLPTLAHKVFDVTGAGDTVMAAMALGLASGLDVMGAGMLANMAASLVVGQVGTAVTSPEELLEALSSCPLLEAETWLAL